MTILYGYKCTFIGSDGGTVTIESDGFRTHEEARRDAFYVAKRLGYYPPKWFEFWRWGEASLLREAARLETKDTHP